MNYLQLDILLRLIIAHILADFIFQPDKWVKHRQDHKINSKYLYYHTIVIGVITFLAFGNYGVIWLPLTITILHFIFDLSKSYIKNNTVVVFLTDQFLHILVIALCWLNYTGQMPVLYNQYCHLFGEPKALLIIASYIIITIPMSIVIRKLTSNWYSEAYSSDAEDSLKNAGKWIGIIERFLALTFSIMGKYEAIGFVLAAKSVFRFNELKNPADRKRTEYILIGTLISFATAIALGMAVRHFIR